MKNQAFLPKNPRNSAANRQSGNIMIMIFIAVALFGALSWAMMQGNRANTGLMTGEQAKIQAQEILSFGNNVREGVKKLLIGGLSIEQISFSTYTTVRQNGAPWTSNSVSCSQDSCRVFKPAGGNVKEVTFHDSGFPSPSWLPTYPHVGGFDFMMMDINGVGTSKPDIVMRVHKIRGEVCDELNKLMGLEIDTDMDDPAGKTFYDTYDIADYMDETDAWTAGYTDSRLVGKRAFCSKNVSERTIFLVIHAL